jgi:hypothetical protein
MGKVDPEKLKRAKTPADRLRMLRIAAGYDRAKDAGNAIGVGSPVSYQHHESGQRNVTREKAKVYAKFYDVSASMILYGEDSASPTVKVPVTGTLGMHFRIIKMRDSTEIATEIDPPPVMVHHKLEAIAVLDNKNYPEYRAGDAVYFEPGALPPGLAGKECVVEISNGERMICDVTEQANGLFTLTAKDRAPMTDMAINFAAPILWVRRDAFDVKVLTSTPRVKAS